MIDSESLLSAVIDRITEENKKAQLARAEGNASGTSSADLKEAAGLFQGLISLAGKILDSSQSRQEGAGASTQSRSKSQAQQRGLVEEIFTSFLFPSVFHKDQDGKSSSLTMKQVIE